MHKIKKMGAGLVLVAFAFSCFAFAADAKKSNSAQGIRIKNGQIASIDYSTKIITVAQNNITYTIDATNAVVKRRYGATAAFTEMITDDWIWVWGTIDGTNITAKRIRDNSIQKWKANFTGTIATIDDLNTYVDNAGNSYQQFTLQSRHRGTQTVRVYNTTRIKYKSSSKNFVDLAIGDTITAKGIWNNTSSSIYNTSLIKIKKLAVGD
jgi:hypothetical protein